MIVRLDFEGKEEELMYHGVYVAINSIDGKIIRDSEDYIFWDEDEDILVSILRSIDYNKFGTVLVRDPDEDNHVED